MVEWIQNIGFSHGAQVQQNVLQAWATGWKGILAKHNMDAWLNRTELGPTGTEYKVRKIDVRGWAPTGVLFFGSQPLLFINLIFHRPSSSYSIYWTKYGTRLSHNVHCTIAHSSVPSLLFATSLSPHAVGVLVQFMRSKTSLLFWRFFVSMCSGGVPPRVLAWHSSETSLFCLATKQLLWSP